MRLAAYALTLTIATLAIPASASADASKTESHAECANGTVTATYVFHDLAGQPISGDVSLVGETSHATVNAFTYASDPGTLTVTLPHAITDDQAYIVVGNFNWAGRTSEDSYHVAYIVDRCLPPILPPPPDPQLEPIPTGQARRAVRAVLSHPKRWKFNVLLYSESKYIFEGTKRRTGTVRRFMVARRFDGLLQVDRI